VITPFLAVTPATAAEMDKDLAEMVYPHGALLRCEKCGRRMNASRQQCVARMGNWWTCCSIQMTTEARVPLPAKQEKP